MKVALPVGKKGRIDEEGSCAGKEMRKDHNTQIDENPSSNIPCEWGAPCEGR